jgi:hypothetical protein
MDKTPSPTKSPTPEPLELNRTYNMSIDEGESPSPRVMDSVIESNK